MQTFLPYESFEKSAEVLDNKRLGKQREEILDGIDIADREMGNKAGGTKGNKVCHTEQNITSFG